MKKILGLAAGLLLTAATFAQTGVKFTDAVDGYNKTTATTFHFNLESGFTLESINTTAAFYTSYFTVAATPGTGGTAIAISLVEDTEMARRVISRFFISLEVQNIEVNGTSMPIFDFMDTHIML